MGIFYLLTGILLIVAFLLIKKSEKKQNIVTWIILSIILKLAYNIFVCMILGTLKIKTNLLCLSIVNLLFTGILAYNIYTKKQIQSYIFNKKDIIAVILVFMITIFVGVKQYKPFDGSIATASVDGCMHYSAAKNFADNMIILSQIDNQTGYNFLTMQPGAYINNGILMSVVRSIQHEARDFITFKVFEIAIFALNILAFYMLIEDRLNSKYKTIIGFIFLILYSFAYPYTSLLYGFSYLSVSIAFCTLMLHLAKLYASKDIKFIVSLVLIILAGFGIIFSYCLFVPAMFSFICIVVFLNDNDEKHKFLKMQTATITCLLLVVTIIGITYLVIPTFTVSTQNKLTDAIGFEGGIYKGLFIDFIFYIPFAIMFIYRSIKSKKLSPIMVAFIIVVFQTGLSLLGLAIGIVSSYYYYKIYSVLYILLVYIAVEQMCELSENKELTVFMSSYLAVFVFIILLAVTEFETRVQMKYPGLMDTVKSNQIAGIYYDTNVASVKNINVSCVVDSNRVKLAEAMGKVEGLTLKNMLVGGMNTNCKAWIYVISGITSGGESINDLQTAVVETTVDDWMKNDEKEFFILFTSDKYEDTNNYELVFQNEAGVILKKK